MEHLKALCDVLGLSLDEAIKGAPEQATTATEQAMLDTMRRLSDTDAEILLAMAKRMGPRQE